MKKTATWLCMAILAGSAFGANLSYNGGGADPNDWFDAGNWSGTGGATNWPTALDSALYPNANKNMVISQVVPAHGQLHAGRGVASMVTIVAGGVVTNLNQTVSGILNNGKGALVIDGGSLVTRQIQVNPAGGTGFVPSTDSIFKVKSGSLQVAPNPDNGNVSIGVNAAGTFELSGGTVSIVNQLILTEGTLRMVGAAGTLAANGNFSFGSAAAKSTELECVLDAAGQVSKVSAATISFVGSQTVTIDGTFCESGAETSVVLIELTGADTFSAAELDALNAKLNLVNVSSGSLSLAGGDKQLVFTGTPVPRQLMKAWEFNTVGDTEGWDSTIANTHLTGITVAADIDGVATVLTCADVAGIDGQLFFNEAQDPGSFIERDGKSWRTMEVRLRQLDANPSEPGVASRLFDGSGATAVLQQPAITLGIMFNYQPGVDVRLDGGDWVVVTYDLSAFGARDLKSLRIDPIGNAANTNFNFEVDYVRLYAGASQPPVAKKLAQAWEFNAPGDAEGWHGLNMSGVTAALDIDGTEGVMTCSDILSTDPQSKYTNTVSIGNGVAWDSIAFRARQLNGNPGTPGVASTNWLGTGTLASIQGKNLGILTNTASVVITTNASDDWVVGVIDISSVGATDMNNLRLDFVGGSAALNIEVDYIRVYKQERLTGYEYWAEQSGLTLANDDPSDDPDDDGANNLYEFAFGGDPINDAVVGALPVGYRAQSGGSNVLEYVYFRNSSPYSGLTYSLEGTENLVYGPWTNDVDYVEVGTGTYAAGLDAVTNHVTIDASAKFIRTKVE